MDERCDGIAGKNFLSSGSHIKDDRALVLVGAFALEVTLVFKTLNGLRSGGSRGADELG